MCICSVDKFKSPLIHVLFSFVLFSTICFILNLQVDLPKEELTLTNDTEDDTAVKILPNLQKYLVVNQNTTNVLVEESDTHLPFYWSVPKEYLGDWVYIPLFIHTFCYIYRRPIVIGLIPCMPNLEKFNIVW